MTQRLRIVLIIIVGNRTV